MIHVAEPTPRVCWVARTSALWPDTILAARCAGRCEDDGIIGIVGGDLVEVARGERLAVVGEYFLRRPSRS